MKGSLQYKLCAQQTNARLGRLSLAMYPSLFCAPAFHVQPFQPPEISLASMNQHELHQARQTICSKSWLSGALQSHSPSPPCGTTFGSFRTAIYGFSNNTSEVRNVCTPCVHQYTRALIKSNIHLLTKCILAQFKSTCLRLQLTIDNFSSAADRASFATAADFGCFGPCDNRERSLLVVLGVFRCDFAVFRGDFAVFRGDFAVFRGDFAVFRGDFT